MDDPIFEEYINELHTINPTINDFFMRDDWNVKNHIQPNIYSEEYYKKINDMNKKFLKRLKKKDNLSFYEEIFKNDLESSIHLEEDYLIYYYIHSIHCNLILLKIDKYPLYYYLIYYHYFYRILI